jgi:multidrug efflux system membrane fusion protein
MLHSRILRNPRIILPVATIGVLLPVAWYALPGSVLKADAATEGAGPKAVPVETATVHRADMPVFLQGMGTMQAFYTVTITARVDGELQNVGFTEGQVVKQGDLLAQIDPRPFQAVLDQAIAVHAKDVAQLASARSDLERYELLAPQDLASKQTLENQRALVAGLRAQIKGDGATIDNARTQLGYTTIRSPINGRTGIRRVDPGNIVHATDTGGIVVVTQVQPISCIVTLPEEALQDVAQALGGGTVEVAAVSRDGKTEFDRGTLAVIDNQIDQATGTIRVKATFPNAKNTLWPGEFVNARLLVRTVHAALTMPTAAIQRGPEGLFTYVVKGDSTVEARTVQVTSESGDVTIVTRGLQAGERVVTSNQYRLQPGARVKFAPAEVASASAHPGEQT